MNLDTGLEEYYTPMGRFLHIPPSNPTDDFVTDFDLPWWMDHLSAEPQYWMGMLPQRTRKIRIVNMLTKDEHTLEVCAEDTVAQIENKYLVYNQHAAGYAWKRLPNEGEGKDMIVLDMAQVCYLKVHRLLDVCYNLSSIAHCIHILLAPPIVATYMCTMVNDTVHTYEYSVLEAWWSK